MKHIKVSNDMMLTLGIVALLGMLAFGKNQLNSSLERLIVVTIIFMGTYLYCHNLKKAVIIAGVAFVLGLLLTCRDCGILQCNNEHFENKAKDEEKEEEEDDDNEDFKNEILKQMKDSVDDFKNLDIKMKKKQKKDNFRNKKVAEDLVNKLKPKKINRQVERFEKEFDQFSSDELNNIDDGEESDDDEPMIGKKNSAAKTASQMSLGEAQRETFKLIDTLEQLDSTMKAIAPTVAQGKSMMEMMGSIKV